jgi:serine/threonine protein kinase
MKALEMSHDIFQLGYVFLVMAMGGFELFEGQELDQETLKGVLNNLQMATPKACCLLHSNDFFQLINSAPSTGKLTSSRISASTTFPQQQFRHLDDFLASNPRVSLEFRSFLCKCLKFEPKDRPSITRLLEHPFLTKKYDKSSVSLVELLRISHAWTIQPYDYQDAGEKQLQKLSEGLAVVLQNCEKWFALGLIYGNIKSLLKPSPQRKPIEGLEEIAIQLGLPREVVYDKFAEVLALHPVFQKNPKAEAQTLE